MPARVNERYSCRCRAIGSGWETVELVRDDDGELAAAVAFHTSAPQLGTWVWGQTGETW